MNRWALSMGVSPREPLSNVATLATAAESYGFEGLWYIDFQLGMKDAYAAMNIAAMATKSMHIGPSVTNLVTRHPTVTANAMTALDELTDGRAPLGIGAGWSAVYGAGGQPSKLGDISNGIDEMRNCAEFVEITSAGIRESHVHDVQITKEAPNYHVD